MTPLHRSDDGDHVRLWYPTGTVTLDRAGRVVDAQAPDALVVDEDRHLKAVGS